MNAPKKQVVIVGGGLAGLACAVRLHEAGTRPLIVEGSDGLGGRVRTDLAVVATDVSIAARLVPAAAAPIPVWRSVTCVYFSADRSRLGEAIIALNGTGSGWVNNVCVPSDLAPDYAPTGRALVSVSVLGNVTSDDVHRACRQSWSRGFAPPGVSGSISAPIRSSERSPGRRQVPG